MGHFLTLEFLICHGRNNGNIFSSFIFMADHRIDFSDQCDLLSHMDWLGGNADICCRMGSLFCVWYFLPGHDSCGCCNDSLEQRYCLESNNAKVNTRKIMDKTLYCSSSFPVRSIFGVFLATDEADIMKKKLILLLFICLMAGNSYGQYSECLTGYPAIKIKYTPVQFSFWPWNLRFNYAQWRRSDLRW